MKTIASKVGRITFLLVTVFTIFSFVSCNKDDESPIGPFTPMKWQSTSYSQIEDNGTHYYVVPSEGGTFKFNCINYKQLLLKQVTLDTEMYYIPYINTPTKEQQEIDKLGFSTSDICNVTIDKNSIEITFKANSNIHRKIEIEVQSANAFGRLFFIQDASQE